MELLEQEELPPEQRIALAYCGEGQRNRFATFLALDRRLANIVAKATEPMLAQMRMAWWREQLSKPAQERPTGDAVLDAIGENWGGREQELHELVDAWELMATADELDEAAVTSFVAGRVQPIVHLNSALGPEVQEQIRSSVARWALADAASHTTPGPERDLMIEQGLQLESSRARLPRELRGIAILDALSLRALQRGGQPLMEGRGSALVALRIGLLGR